MDKNEIRLILKDADKEKYSHVLICVDSWDYDYFSEYVKRKDDIDDFIENFYKEHEGGMIRVVEIYNLDLDINKQLNEPRSYHREKISRKKLLEKYPEMETKSEKALRFATEKHKGQYRKGKNPKEYITHPINVAKLIEKYKGNSSNIDELITAAYLHDTLEDTDVTYYELLENFGPLPASIIMEVTSNKEMQNLLGKNVYLSLKMLSMTSYALTLKLCDRLDNIMGLDDVDYEFRQKYINETIYIVDELFRKRKLNKTQLRIITDILFNIIKLRKLDNKDNNDVLDLVLTCNEFQKV